jgi:AraC-like DNA-binding protein
VRKEGEILEEKVMLASDNPERAPLVSAFLIKPLVNVRTEYSNIFSTIRNTVNENYPCSIAKLASDCNLSSRQFERKFKEFSGFSPRVFLNIARFAHIFKNNINTTKILTEIAYESGYYDQPHFIRDFRKFSAYSPKEYFKYTQCSDYRATTEFQI